MASSLRYWATALSWADRVNQSTLKAFFGPRNQYPFSNHAAVPFVYKGQHWLTSEHAYLAQQADHYGMKDLARVWASAQGSHYAWGRWYQAANPKHIKSWSTQAFRSIKRNPNHPLVKSWNAKRDQIMYGIVLAKFRGNTEARKALLATGNQFLVEASPSDKHWGAGTNASDQELFRLIHEGRLPGVNRLGLILMAVRKQCHYANHGMKELKKRTLRYLARREAAKTQTLPTLCKTREEWAATMAHFPRCFLPKAALLVHRTIKGHLPTMGATLPRPARRRQAGKCTK